MPKHLTISYGEDGEQHHQLFDGIIAKLVWSENETDGVIELRAEMPKAGKPGFMQQLAEARTAMTAATAAERRDELVDGRLRSEGLHAVENNHEDP